MPRLELILWVVFSAKISASWARGATTPWCTLQRGSGYHHDHRSPNQEQRHHHHHHHQHCLPSTRTKTIAFTLKRPTKNHSGGAPVIRLNDRFYPATRRSVSGARVADCSGSRGTHHRGDNERFMFSIMASKCGKGKTSKSTKKRARRAKAGGNQGGDVSFDGGVGFGAAPALTVGRADLTSPDPTAVSSERTNRRSSVPRQAELPDDDFATFPPLSSATLESVMGLDVFDLPAGGIAASEKGLETSLPHQVLECIRDRHGMPEFAGGRRLLDAEYSDPSDEGGRDLGGDNGSGDVERDRTRSPLLFPGLRLLHAEPPVIGVDDFFTAEECDAYVSRSISPVPEPFSGRGPNDAGPHVQRSATLGADVDAVAQRTSTTWFHRYSAVPELMAKASALVGIPFDEERWEEAQTVRYRPGEKFTWHLDALPPTPDLSSKGGQRIATLLVYLTEMPEGDGGATAFRDLGPLRVRPRKGSALLFFPACGGAPDCPFDIRTLHAGEVVRPGGEQDKWIAQLWLRERAYTPTVPKGNKHTDASSVVTEFDARWRQQPQQ